jgi:alkylhydroperoxidase/carboxymuconolactone decarboxylase family protein YurZ
MKVRKAVLGAEHVEKSMGAVSEFAMPIQHIVTEACWGAIWTRPGLERKTRSMINIAMLTALNRYFPCVSLCVLVEWLSGLGCGGVCYVVLCGEVWDCV